MHNLHRVWRDGRLRMIRPKILVQAGVGLASLALAGLLVVGVATAKAVPVMTSPTGSTIVVGTPFVLNGSNFQGHQSVHLVLSDGQDFVLRTTGGRFSVTITVPVMTPDHKLVVNAYDGATGELLATSG
jgi:hypothetical protein